MNISPTLKTYLAIQLYAGVVKQGILFPGSKGTTHRHKECVKYIHN